MGSNNILVKEYLESLKEDKELDYLFPILLNLMGFKIVTTAKESKGQPQYGKDLVAIGKDENGLKKRFYFELKGHCDKDITQTSFLAPDGIRESILESKITSFNDSSVPGFNALPVQIVVVHNGVLKSNTRRTFEDFISKEFPNGGFERWDIYRLTDLFGDHLFSEYLFTDDETIRLFKRTLVLLNAQDYQFQDFKQLVQLQINKIAKVEGRAFKKFFATMNLLCVVIIHYSKENNNLAPARECVTYLLLNVWSWILKNKIQAKEAVKREFRKLLTIHFDLLTDYFKKTAVVFEQQDGLFSEKGGLFEEIGYPVRCFDFLSYLIYYFEARIAYPRFDGACPDNKLFQLLNHQLEHLIQLLNNNKGCCRPLIDNHSIPIISVCLYILKYANYINDPNNVIKNYVSETLNHILIIKRIGKRFPEMHNNIEALTELVATTERPHDYDDSSSLLITMLFELIAVCDAEDIYDHFKGSFSKEINLQTAHSEMETAELEPLLFNKSIYREMYVETDIKLPESFEEFKNKLRQLSEDKRIYLTDLAGFDFLRILANNYYKNEFFVEEWRKYLQPLEEFDSADSIE
jgi:hypothetical protein